MTPQVTSPRIPSAGAGTSPVGAARPAGASYSCAETGAHRVVPDSSTCLPTGQKPTRIRAQAGDQPGDMRKCESARQAHETGQPNSNLIEARALRLIASRDLHKARKSHQATADLADALSRATRRVIAEEMRA